jgi:MFS family permease
VTGFTSLLSLLRHRDFALLWWGGLVSLIGNGFTIVAISWLLAERGSPEHLGLFFLVFEVAAIGGGLLLTGIMDAYSRRRLMILDSVIRGLAVALIPAVELVTPVGLGVLLVSAAVLGVSSPAAAVGQRAMVVELLDETRLGAANAAESIQWTTSWLVGPAIGGLLVAVIGPLPTLWIDAATFLVFVLALGAMSARADRLPRRASQRRSYRADLAEGLAYVRRERLVWTIVQLTAGARFAEGVFLVALPFLVIEVGGEAHHLGLLLAVGGAGSLLGSLVAAAVRLPLAMTHAITLCAAAGGVAMLLTSLTPPLWLLTVIFATETIISAPWNIYILTLRQRVPPQELVGRVLSLTMLLNSAGQPAGSAAGGALLGPIGLPAVLAGCGVLQIANAASSLLSRTWRTFPMRTTAEPEPAPVVPEPAAAPGTGA